MQSFPALPKSSIFGAARVWGQSFLHSFLAAIPAHSLLYVAAFTMALAAFAVARQSGAAFTIGLQASLIITLFYTLLAGATGYKLLHLFFAVKSPSPARDLLIWARSYAGDMRFLANGLHALILFVIFASAFGILKAKITELVPFYLDEILAIADRILHFGVHPWQILHPIFGYPLMTWILNAVYSSWFLLVVGFYMGFGFQRRATALRHRYLLATILCWGIGGSLLATLLSSAGPVYYSAIGLAPDPYAPLMTYLKQANSSVGIIALQVQDMLWMDYSSGAKTLGISALPSMHVATSTLFYLAARHIHPIFARAMALYAVAIFLGSIHLGWHYAVDGYAGALVAVVCWWSAGRLYEWWFKTSGQDDLNSPEALEGAAR